MTDSEHSAAWRLFEGALIVVPALAYASPYVGGPAYRDLVVIYLVLIAGFTHRQGSA